MTTKVTDPAYYGGLPPSWNAQNSGIANEAVTGNAGTSEANAYVTSVNGSTGAVTVIDAAVAKAATQSAASAPVAATVTGVTGTDAANLAKQSDLAALTTAYNALLAALQTAKIVA